MRAVSFGYLCNSTIAASDKHARGASLARVMTRVATTRPRNEQCVTVMQVQYCSALISIYQHSSLVSSDDDWTSHSQSVGSLLALLHYLRGDPPSRSPRGLRADLGLTLAPIRVASGLRGASPCSSSVKLIEHSECSAMVYAEVQGISGA